MNGTAGRNQRGLTIIEMMISLTIIVVLVGLVSGAMGNYLRATTAARNTVDIVGRHELVLRRIREELRQSSANRFTEKYWIEDGGTTMRLNKLIGFTVDAQGRVTMTWSTDIVYTLNADGIVTRSQDGNTVDIAGGITALEFTEIANGRVQIRLANEAGADATNTRARLDTTIEVTPQN